MFKRIYAVCISCILISLIFIVLGFWKNEMLITMGIVMFCVSTVKMIRYALISRDKEKREKLEITMSDERNIFLSNKSNSISFWLSVYAMFFISVVLLAMNKDDYGVLICYLICGMLVLRGAVTKVISGKY